MNNAISVLPGVKSIQSVYGRLLSGAKADFVCLSSGYQAVIGDWYDDEYSPKLFASSVATREVVAESS